MTVKRAKSAAAFSLVEVMVAILILSVAVIGASAYRYYAALDARKASVRITAARMGVMLCESWRGVSGVETFAPTAYFGTDIAITDGEGPAVPEGFTALGSYEIVSNGVNYYATLSWQDVGTGLRALNVAVAWPLRDQGASSLANTDRVFELTTYVSN